ncbi:MAG: hypothetical protein M1370_01955 [Bacteroidetes bacterium]|nr:hypothetical protein [Bacteroidota bacterium]
MATAGISETEDLRGHLVALDAEIAQLHGEISAVDERAARAVRARDGVAAAHAWDDRAAARARLELAEAERTALLESLIAMARVDLDAWQRSAELAVSGWRTEQEAKAERVRELMAALVSAVADTATAAGERRAQREGFDQELRAILERVGPFDEEIQLPEVDWSVESAMDRGTLGRELLRLVATVDPLGLPENWDEAVFRSTHPELLLRMVNNQPVRFHDGWYRTSDPEEVAFLQGVVADAARGGGGVWIHHLPQIFKQAAG